MEMAQRPRVCVIGAGMSPRPALSSWLLNGRHWQSGWAVLGSRRPAMSVLPGASATLTSGRRTLWARDDQGMFVGRIRRLLL